MTSSLSFSKDLLYCSNHHFNRSLPNFAIDSSLFYVDKLKLGLHFDTNHGTSLDSKDQDFATVQPWLSVLFLDRQQVSISF